MVVAVVVGGGGGGTSEVVTTPSSPVTVTVWGSVTTGTPGCPGSVEKLVAVSVTGPLGLLVPVRVTARPPTASSAAAAAAPNSSGGRLYQGSGSGSAG
ncbi:hypothetical protein MYFR107205_30825 [Mycolicibacterium frederiksbergense]